MHMNLKRSLTSVIQNIEKIIENSSSKGGTFLIIGPVKAGANATKSHRTGSYDVN